MAKTPLFDCVRETTQTGGTGTLTLLGAVVGRQGFSVVGNGNWCVFRTEDQGGPNWEVSRGIYNAGTLTRATVLSSSNAGALVSFPTNTVKNVFLVFPSEYPERVYNAVLWGAKGDGATDDSTAINAAITAANADGGGKVILNNNTTFAVASSVLLLNDVTVQLGPGTILKWTGGASGALVSNSNTVPLVRAKFMGERSILDANSKAIWLFDFHSIQFSEVGNFYIQNCVGTNCLRLRADCLATTGSPFGATAPASRHCVLSYFHDIFSLNTANTTAEFIHIEGFQSGLCTLNTFERMGPIQGSTTVYGINIVSASDNNYFYTIQLSQSGATSIAVALNTSSVSQVEQYTITNAGTNYTSAPTVTFTLGGASVQATAFSLLSGTTVGSICLTAKGTGYAASGGQGTGGTLNIVASGGVIQSATVNAAGSGYPKSTSIHLAVVGGNSNGEISLTTNASGGLAGTVTIVGGGTGYTTANGVATINTPVISFSGGGGSGAAATAYLGGPTVNEFVYGHVFVNLSLFSDGAVGQQGFVFNNCSLTQIYGLEVDSAFNAGAVVDNGSGSHRIEINYNDGINGAQTQLKNWTQLCTVNQGSAVKFTSSSADGNGFEYTFLKNRAGGATLAGDVGGDFNWNFYNSTPAETQGMILRGSVNTPTAGSEVFDCYLYLQDAGMQQRLFINGNGPMFVTPPVASVCPLAVQGLASQTGDLHQWQNSAATVLSRVTPAGWIRNDPGLARLTGTATASSTVMVNLTDLTIPNVVTGRNYFGRLTLFAKNATAASGLKVDFAGGTATASAAQFGIATAQGATIGTATSTALATAVTITNMGVTTDIVVEIAFEIACNGTGTIIPRFANNSGLTTSTIETGSSFTLDDSPN